MTADVFIAVGSNLGDRQAHFRAADQCLRLAAEFQGVTWSPIYETRPVGGPAGQPDYLNAVVRASSLVGPKHTLRRLQDIEERLGRRRAQRWAPRIIDLDLLLYGPLVLDTPELTLPHPRLHLRRFVLQPLCDLAPDLTHPASDHTVRHMLARLGPDDTVIRKISSGFLDALGSPDRPSQP
jgi:2-amino-4-hydroxy-6-hydroxymethyldihydropteridine diphosphokinase